MGLFNRKPKQDDNGYYLTGISAESVQTNQMTPFSAADEDIIFTKLGDEIVAFTGTCPHAAADLCDGRLNRGQISCSLHDWKFDIKSGQILWPPDEYYRLKRFEVSVVDGQLRVKI